MKSFVRHLVTGMSIFAIGTPFAIADVSMPINSTQNTQKMGSQSAASVPTMPTQSPKNMPVSHEELKHFAAALVDIHPLDEKAHAKMMAAKKDPAAQHQVMVHYSKKIEKVLEQHHLTPTRYEMLLTKAQTDPAFAKRTESAIKKSV
jgi:hypothetical protein